MVQRNSLKKRTGYFWFILGLMAVLAFPGQLPEQSQMTALFYSASRENGFLKSDGFSGAGNPLRDDLRRGGKWKKGAKPLASAAVAPLKNAVAADMLLADISRGLTAEPGIDGRREHHNLQIRNSKRITSKKKQIVSREVSENRSNWEKKWGSVDTDLKRTLQRAMKSPKNERGDFAREKLWFQEFADRSGLAISYFSGGRLKQGEKKRHRVTVSRGTEFVMFIVFCHEPGVEPRICIEGEHGTGEFIMEEIKPGAGPSYKSLGINRPVEGLRTLCVESLDKGATLGRGEKKTGKTTYTYNVLAMEKNSTLSTLFIASTMVDRAGGPVLLTARFTEKGGRQRRAAVRVEVTLPGDKKSKPVIFLADDGSNGDSFKNDGIYTAYFKETAAAGNYRFRFLGKLSSTPGFHGGRKLRGLNTRWRPAGATREKIIAVTLN